MDDDEEKKEAGASEGKPQVREGRRIVRHVVAVCSVCILATLAIVAERSRYAPVPSANDPRVSVGVGGEVREAAVVHLESATSAPSHLLKGTLLLVVLDVPHAVPDVRYVNHAIDCVWIAAGGQVVGTGRELHDIGKVPNDARYLLIGEHASLPEQVFAEGALVVLPATL